MRKTWKPVGALLAAVLALAGLASRHHTGGGATSGTPAAPVAGSCASTHPGGLRPSMPVGSTASSRILCSGFFEVLHSGVTRTPLWASEILTPASVVSARSVERVDAFTPDRRLPERERSELEDYRRSGWDRGHLAPSGDMPDAASQERSFAMSNIAPQEPALNRGAWSDLESDVRRHVVRHGPAYVVTGTLYEGRSVGTLPDGRVAIPTSMWKAVLSPGLGSVVMVARNAPDARPLPSSLASFGSRTGIDPFPSAAATDRATILDLED